MLCETRQTLKMAPVTQRRGSAGWLICVNCVICLINILAWYEGKCCLVIRKRRIYAALIDGLIVAFLETIVLLLVGHETLLHLFHQKVRITTDLGSFQIAAGPFLMMLDWFLIALFDGLFVFVQPLALVSLGKVTQLASTAQGQLWLISGGGLLVNAVYRITCEFLPQHASFGMRIFRLRVVYGKYTLRRNPVVRHLAKVASMPVILMANMIGLPFAFVFARSEESDLGYSIRKLAGSDAEELMHDELATVQIESY